MNQKRKIAMTQERNPTEAELEKLFVELCNWGKWGPDDQLGALNYLTPAKIAEAGALARAGRTISVAQPLSTKASADNPSPVTHLMCHVSDLEMTADYFTIYNHGMAMTHIDALCHMHRKGKLYNGYSLADEVKSEGARVCSIDALKNGVVTKGVLLDIPRLKGVRWLEPKAAIYPDDLEAAEERQKVRVGAGDALLVRTGRGGRNQELGGGDAVGEGLAGLHTSCLRWLSERKIALMGSDGVSDLIPSGHATMPFPIHTISIVAMGIHLIDNCDFEELANACESMARAEFMFALAPLILKGGTGSPVNPVAVL
jgi:kynurenine formamidase